MGETNPVVNIDNVPLRDAGNGKSFKSKVGSFGKQIGAQKLGVMLHVVEAGQKAFPFHVHHQIEEMFIILEGEGTYRFGAKEYPVKAGDICSAPTGGAEHAHQLINSGKTTLKYLGVSTDAETEVVEYPDSGKISVLSRFDWSTMSGGVRNIFRPGASLDYFDGEE